MPISKGLGDTSPEAFVYLALISLLLRRNRPQWQFEPVHPGRGINFARFHCCWMLWRLN
jgi:hypothetical protein